MRVGRRVSPNQTALWTICELVTPTRIETPDAHPASEFRVGVLGITVIVKRAKIRPSDVGHR